MRMNDLNLRKLPRFCVRHTKPTLFYSFVAERGLLKKESTSVFISYFTSFSYNDHGIISNRIKIDKNGKRMCLLI